MKIAFLHQLGDPYAIVRMKALRDLNFDVISITFPKKNTLQEEIDGILHLELPRIFLHKNFFFKRVIYICHLMRLIKRLKIDIFHIINALNAAYLISGFNKITILEIEGSDIIRTPVKYRFLKLYYKFFFPYATSIILDSAVAQKSLNKSLGSNFSSKIIQFGIDLEIFNCQIEFGRARKKIGIGKKPMVLHTRGPGKIYNLITILKSIPIITKRFPEITFVFTFNEDDLDLDCKNFIKSKKLNQNLKFIGRINHESEMKFFCRDADLMVSIPLSDSSPFSVYESMAVKTPVIASMLPWIEGTFKPKKHLLTIEATKYRDLANSIIDILSSNTSIDLELAKQIVEKKFNLRNETLKLVVHYKSLYTR